MRILLLTTKVPFPARDGGSLAILTWIQSLVEMKHQVTILAANTPKHQVDINFSTNIPGVRIIPIPVNTNIRISGVLRNLFFSELPFMVTRFRNTLYVDKLNELLDSGNYEVVQLEGAPMGIYLDVCRKYPDIRVILRAHNVESLLWQDIKTRSRSWLKRWYLGIQVSRYNAFEISVFNQVDGVISISERDKIQICEMAQPARIQSIGFGLDMSHYMERPVIGNSSIYFMGALDWIPNQEGLLWFVEKVWPRLYEEAKDITFQVAGRNAPEWIKNRLNLPGIFFHGEVDDAIRFSQSCQLMVVPLFSGSGIRIKILEAMALGKVVITTPKGAEGLEGLSGNELIIVQDEKDFAAMILGLMCDQEKIKTLGRRARDFVSRNYEISRIKKKMDDCYKDINLR